MLFKQRLLILLFLRLWLFGAAFPAMGQTLLRVSAGGALTGALPI